MRDRIKWLAQGHPFSSENKTESWISLLSKIIWNKKLGFFCFFLLGFLILGTNNIWSQLRLHCRSLYTRRFSHISGLCWMPAAHSSPPTSDNVYRHWQTSLQVQNRPPVRELLALVHNLLSSNEDTDTFLQNFSS